MKKYLWMPLFVLLCGCAGTSASTSLAQVTESPGERVAQIRTALLDIPGVTDSAVVVAGHTAIIGLRTEAEGAALGRLMQEAERAAIGADGSLQMVSVTANEAIVSRMEQTAKGA